jgi:hypothetical protein
MSPVLSILLHRSVSQFSILQGYLLPTESANLVYANSFLATLNTRKLIQRDQSDTYALSRSANRSFLPKADKRTVSVSVPLMEFGHVFLYWLLVYFCRLALSIFLLLWQQMMVDTVLSTTYVFVLWTFLKFFDKSSILSAWTGHEILDSSEPRRWGRAFLFLEMIKRLHC